MMEYSQIGIYRAIALLIIGGRRVWFGPKPGFLIPRGLVREHRLFFIKIVCGLIFASVLFLCLDLRWVSDARVVKEKTLNVQLLFDVSLSMAGQDIAPSRFHSARDAVVHLFDRLSGYNMSLITFSGRPFVYLPFSTHTPSMKYAFQQTQLADFPPLREFAGTQLGDAILLGIKNLKAQIQDDNAPDAGVMILLTDGASYQGFEPADTIPILQKFDIPLFTLGIGEDEDLIIGQTHQGIPQGAEIDISLLKKLANETDGAFYRVYDTQDFEDIFDILQRYIKHHEIKTVQYSYTSVNTYLLPFLLVMMCVYLIVRRTWRRL